MKLAKITQKLEHSFSTKCISPVASSDKFQHMYNLLSEYYGSLFMRLRFSLKKCTPLSM